MHLPPPRHVAFIMDGNGRWANAKGMSRVAGHRRGVETVRSVVEWCADLKIEYVTLFAFSSENWSRPKTEINVLMDLLAKALQNDTLDMAQRGIRLRVIGATEQLPEKLQRSIVESESLTKDNSSLNLTLAINYGGRWDILEGVRKAVELAKAGQLDPEDIDQHHFSTLLSTADIPDPDLIIRTSGEHRISNYLLWQCAYSEFYFSDIRWPDFRREELERAIEEYHRRDRRFGGAVDAIQQHNG